MEIPFVDELFYLLQAPYPYIYLVTHEESRTERFVKSIIEKSGRPLDSWRATEGEDIVNSLDDALDRLSHAADGAILIMFDIHPYMDNPLIIRRFRDLVDSLMNKNKAILFISPSAQIPFELDKDIYTLEVPLPSPSELEQILNQILVEKQIIFDVEFIEQIVRAACGLTEREAIRVFIKALAAGGGHNLSDVIYILEEKKQILRRNSFLEYCDAQETLKDVGGLGEVKRWLQERTDAFGVKAREFGLPQPKGMMFVGIQGCGKTITTKAVANFWKLPLIRLSLSALFTQTSSAEDSLRIALRRAETISPIVLWLEEVDTGLTDILQDGEQGSKPRLVNVLTNWLQEKQAPVFVVATANRIDILPPELVCKGRFDEIFFIDLPNIKERNDIFAIHLQKRERDPFHFDVEKLAKESQFFSGAEIEHVVVSALYRAFAENRSVQKDDILTELKSTVPLYYTFEERVKGLREWAKHRARWANFDSSLLDLFDMDEEEQG